MKKLYILFTVILCMKSGSYATALVKQVNGVATNETHFCSGVILTFVCNIRASIYSWEIGPLLNEVISLTDRIKTVNGRSLSAQGQSDTRTSSLTLTTSVEWNGHEIVCYETANRVNGIQTSTISVWDPPSAPGITAVGSLDLSSFTLTVTPPVTSPGCVSLYSLTVRQDGVVVFTGSFGNESLLDGNIDLKTITGDNLAVSTCQYNYSFELTPVGGNESRGEQEGNPNLNAIVSRASQYSILNKVITWSESSFPEVHSTCIIGYEFSVNDEVQGFINVNNPSLEISNFNISDSACDETFITIRPVVEINNTVLVNVFINVALHELSKLAVTTMKYQCTCDKHNGVLAGVSSVAALTTITSIIVIVVLIVKVKRLKLQFTSQERNDRNHTVENKEVKNQKDQNTSMSNDSDIGMMKCQAYGEVGVKYMAGGNIKDNTAVSVYEHI